MAKEISSADSNLFRDSIGKVQAVKHDRILPSAKKPKSIRKKLFDEIDNAKDLSIGIEAPVYSDTILEFSRSGVQPKQLRKLRTGKLFCQAECDLHGLTIKQAEQRLEEFINYCLNRHYRVVRIIHGKGQRSENNNPVLKNLINQSLREFTDILAFHSAPSNEGGAGSVYVLLKNKDSQ